MRGPFRDARVLLGISGSIAAYKAVDLASKLTQAGAIVDVLMTPSAARFVTPLSPPQRDPPPGRRRPVRRRLARGGRTHRAGHRRRRARRGAGDPPHLIAKLALGLADDPISLTALATDAPLVIAPAMDALMWDTPPPSGTTSTS